MPIPGKRLISGSSHAFPWGKWISFLLFAGLGVGIYLKNSPLPTPAQQAMLLAAVAVTGLIALGTFWRAALFTLRHLRYRGLQLELTPETAVAGEEFAGTLLVPVPFRAGCEFKVELSAAELTAVRKSDRQGDGYSYQTLSSPLYSDACSARAGASGLGTLLHFAFRLPADAQPSLGYAESVSWTAQTANRVYVKWRLGITADAPGVALDESFEIPVVQPDPTGLSMLAAGNPSFVVVEAANTVSVTQPAWKKPGRGEWFADACGVSVGVGAIIGFRDAGAFLTAMMFLPVAAAWAAIAAFHAQELAVSISSAGLRVTRRIGTYALTDVNIGRMQIKAIEVVPSFGRFAGGIAARTVRVRTADDETYALAQFVTSARDILALCSLLAERLALRPQAIVGASEFRQQAVHVYESSAPSVKRLGKLGILALLGLVLWPWVSAFYEANWGAKPARVAAVQPASPADPDQPAALARAAPRAPPPAAPVVETKVDPWWPRIEHALAENSAQRFTEAEQELQRILSDVERESGRGHPMAGLLHHQLAMVYRNQRRLADREAELKRALDIFEAQPVKVVKAALGPIGWAVDRESVARELGDLLWEQRRVADAYRYYERAHAAAAELDATEDVRNDRLALAAAGVMVTSCALQKWDVAEKAMAEVKQRYPAASPVAQPRLKYWIDSGEPRLKARNCS